MGQPIKNAFVVNGYTGLADAAGTGGIAAKLNVPLVFTDKNIDRYKNSLNDLNINNVFLIGGTYNLPEGFNNVVNSERIAGSNRRDTNAKLIEKFFGKDYNSAFIAKDGSNNESELIDSVTIGGVAGLKNMPIFLGSKTAGLTNEQLEQLKASAPKHIVGVGGGNKTAGNQIEKQLPNAQIDISEITSKPSEDEEVPSSGGGGGGGGSSTNTEQDKKNSLIKTANEHLDGVIKDVNNNSAIKKVLNMQFDKESNKTTITVISNEIPENLNEINNTGFIDGILNTPNLESYSVVDGKNELVELKANGNDLSAQELKKKILEDVMEAISKQLTTSDDTTAAEETSKYTSNTDASTGSTNDETVSENEKTNNTKSAYDIVKENIGKIDGKSVIVNANYNDGKTKASVKSVKYEFIFKVDKNQIEKNNILSKANKHLETLVKNVAEKEAVSKYATISFDPDSMVTDIVSKEMTSLPDKKDLEAISGTGFITGLKATPNLVSYSIGNKNTVIKGENNESELKNSIISDVLTQFEGIDNLNNIPEKKTITVTANYEDGDIKLSQDYKFNFDFSNMKKAIGETQTNTENDAVSRINLDNDNVSINTDSEKKKIKLEIKNLSFFESNSNELLEKIKSIDQIKAIKLNGKEINISDLNGETLHKELLKTIDYDNIDDHREFFKTSKVSEVSSKTNSDFENKNIINNFIKLDSKVEASGKTVPIYFLLKDKTGEFLSSEYKIDFIFNEELKSKVDKTIKNSIENQDKTIIDTRKYFLGQYKVNKNKLMLYNFSDNMVEVAINEIKNEVDLFNPISFIINTRATGLKTTIESLSNINDLNSISINNDPNIYDKSNTLGVKNTLNKELEIKNTRLKSYINKAFNLNLYSSKDKINFKRTIKVTITNNFEKLAKELEKINIK